MGWKVKGVYSPHIFNEINDNENPQSTSHWDCASSPDELRLVSRTAAPIRPGHRRDPVLYHGSRRANIGKPLFPADPKIFLAHEMVYECINRAGRLRDRFCATVRICQMARLSQSLDKLQGDPPSQGTFPIRSSSACMPSNACSSDGYPWKPYGRCCNPGR